VLPDGAEHDIDVPSGQTVMDGSVRNNLPGIIAECGGSCSCATCHVYVEDHAEFFDEPTDEERDLLEYAEAVQPNSRLSCQLIMRDACPHLRVTVAVTDG
jgi:2Fe-2S ferredoxin